MTEEILYISLLTLGASILGTVSGFGISTLMVPVMLSYFPLPMTLLFVALVHWFGDLWKIFLFKHGFRWKIILGFAIPGMIASYLGARMTLNVSVGTLSTFIGVFLIGYVLFIFFDPKFKLIPNYLNSIFGGILSGFTGGLTGVAGGAIRSVFLNAFNLKNEIYVFTSGLIGAALDITRIIGYWEAGTRIGGNLIYGLPFYIAVTFIGAEIGKVFVDKIPQSKFRFVISVFLLAAGIKLIFFR